MTNRSKAKGDAAERAVVSWLRANGFPRAERVRAGWAQDRGDIDNIPGACIEVKAEQRIDLPAYMRQLAGEIATSRARTGVVIVKRRGTTDVGDWYACAPVRTWVELLKEATR